MRGGFDMRAVKKCAIASEGQAEWNCRKINQVKVVGGRGTALKIGSRGDE
jgi:hypothetical protein